MMDDDFIFLKGISLGFIMAVVAIVIVVRLAISTNKEKEIQSGKMFELNTEIYKCKKIEDSQ